MPFPRFQLDGWPRPAQWVLLAVVSLLVAAMFETIRMPASLLLGPMLAGIAVALSGGSIRLHRAPFFASQTIIGCLIASSITAGIVGSLSASWPIFVVVTLTVLVASNGIGILIGRWRILPGAAGVWGSTPGAATAMMVLAEAYGADVRLVAFMQYMRIVCVTAIASGLAAALGPSSAPPSFELFPPIALVPFASTLLLALVGGGLGVALRLPAGLLLGPLAIGSVLHATGLITIELPPWLLTLSYTAVGWKIGLGFTREALWHVQRAFWRILASTLFLIALCAALAALVVAWAGVDPLTAYLATSPGGLDAVAIIGASTKVDLPFVMGLQTFRYILVLLIGPRVAQFAARRWPGDPESRPVQPAAPHLRS